MIDLTRVARLSLIASLLLATGCGWFGDDSNDQLATIPPPPSSRITVFGAFDSGDFKVLYPPALGGPGGLTQLTAAQNLARRSGVIEALAQALNQVVALPRDIPVQVSPCADVNAWWDGTQITICSGFIETLDFVFRDHFGFDAAEGDKQAMEATGFFFLHEVGHALIDVHQIAFTGNEEDVADQLATLLMIGSPPGENAIVSGANSFTGLSALQGNVSERRFWDEHSFNEQRSINLLCWLLGSNTQKYAYLVSETGVHPQRARLCPDQFEKMQRGWSERLAPFFKPAH